MDLPTSNLSWKIPLKCDGSVHGCEQKLCPSLSLGFHYWNVSNQSAWNFQTLAVHGKSPTNMDINLGGLKRSYCIVSPAASQFSWFLSVCIQPSLIIVRIIQWCWFIQFASPIFTSKLSLNWYNIFDAIIRQQNKCFLRRDAILRYCCLHLRAQNVN
jgi:hypothetical protein